MRSLVLCAVAAISALMMIPETTSAQALCDTGPCVGGGVQAARPGGIAPQGRGYRQGYGRGNGRYYRRHGYGVGAGIAGLAAGAIIGGAIASQQGYYGQDDYPVYQGDEGYQQNGDGYSAYCANRYRSYDPASGTYLGYDGMRHPCP